MCACLLHKLGCSSRCTQALPDRVLEALWLRLPGGAMAGFLHFWKRFELLGMGYRPQSTTDD